MKDCMKKRLLFLIAACSLSLQLLYAVDISLELPDIEQQEVNGRITSVVEAQTPFQIQVHVTGGSRNTGDVELQGLDKLVVRGQSQSTNISVVNGSVSSDKTYIFEVVAPQKGSYTVGPAKVRDGNTTLSSSQLSFQAFDKIVQQSAGNQPTAQNQAKNEVFAHFSLDKKELVVGETVSATLKIFVRGAIVDISTQPLDVAGASVQEVGEPKRYQTTKDGVHYVVFEKKYSVTARDLGDKILGPVALVYTVQTRSQKKTTRGGGIFADDIFDQFFNAPRLDKKQVLSDSVSFSVQKLPSHQGRVDGVGDFTSFSLHVNQIEVHVNEPVTLRIELDGKGNFEQVPDPILELPRHVRFYKSKTSIVPDPNESGKGKKVFEFIIQPKKAGELKIPEQVFTYYNTERGFQTLKTNELVLNVRAVADAENAHTGGDSTSKSEYTQEKTSSGSSAETGKDIHFIIQDPSGLKAQAPSLPWWMLIIIVIVSLLATQGWLVTLLFGTVIGRVSKSRERDNVSKQLEHDFEIICSKKDAAKLYQFFMKLLSFVFKRPINDLTEPVIEQLLLKKGFEEEKIREFVHYLNECASLSFSSARHQHSEHQETLKRAQYWFLIVHEIK